MKTGVFGMVLAVWLLMNSLAHSMLGWPPIARALIESGVPADLQAGLGVGWHFGGGAMMAFALLVGVQAMRGLRGQRIDAATLHVIAAMYLVFGAVAFVARDFNPFFLMFIATGALVTAFAVLADRGARAA